MTEPRRSKITMDAGDWVTFEPVEYFRPRSSDETDELVWRARLASQMPLLVIARRVDTVYVRDANDPLAHWSADVSNFEWADRPEGWQR